MCVLSMVMDHYNDEWNKRLPKINPIPPTDWERILQEIPQKKEEPVRPITKEEVEEFRRLLERAREYDKRNNEPDCEMEDKKRMLKELAEKLGVDISFIDD